MSNLADVYRLVPLTNVETGRVIKGNIIFPSDAGALYYSVTLWAEPWWTANQWQVSAGPVDYSPPTGRVEGNWTLSQGTSLLLDVNQAFRCIQCSASVQSVQNAFEISSLGNGVVQFQASFNGVVVDQFTTAGQDDPYAFAVFSDQVDIPSLFTGDWRY
ncbi:MAG TPA: hypothetical protein VGN12_27440 [Pirellulales bacterium]|jgi:hypothetical protein